MRPKFLSACLIVMCTAWLPVMTSSAAETTPAVDISAHEGKVVLLDFWASWCVPCRRSFPWMKEMHEKYADDGLVIIAVNMDADADDAAGFLNDYSPPFKIAYDPKGILAREFDVIAMPSSYVFDRYGNQTGRHLGFKVNDQNEYESLLVELLNK